MTTTRLSLAVFAPLLGIASLSATAAPPGNQQVIRMAVVRTIEHSGVIDQLVASFEAKTGYRVQVIAGTQDIFDLARQGGADLLISHYGIPEVEAFVRSGLGAWPRAVFANQSVLIGPPGDPAKVVDAPDVTEAFRRIARSRTPFMSNNLVSLEALVELLWEGAGRPERDGWFLDEGLAAHEAVERAAALGAYTFWGADPFIRYQEHHHLPLAMLSTADPVLQRMMVSIVVQPNQLAGTEGARALESYLLASATQARVRAFRYPGVEAPLWWPAGLNN